MSTEAVHASIAGAAGNNGKQDEEEGNNPKRFFDSFCDYTSISGFRFLHSRYPLWFRGLSAVVLFGSIGMFLFHASIYFRRLNDKRNSIQMFTTKVPSLSVPYVIICPLRQFKGVLHYEGPADFAHILSHFYSVPAQMPVVDGFPVLHSATRALHWARNFSAFVDGAAVNASQVMTTAEDFAGDRTFQQLFPRCVLLMRLSSVRNLARHRHSIYGNYSNFREWQLHQQTDTTIGEESSILRLAKCRANEVVQMLEAVLQQMRNFGDYVRKARPRMEDLVLHCRWLDGGPCLLDWVSSEIGVYCVKVGGRNQTAATYICCQSPQSPESELLIKCFSALRNNLDVVLDLFALDNQLSSWEKRELQILLKAENLSSVCTGIDGFV